MDTESQAKLSHILRNVRVASLGTLRNGYPFVSMILFVPAPDFSAFYIHASKLAVHTQDMLQDPRVSLMVMEQDDIESNPQTLPRVSISGEVGAISPEDEDFNLARALYLKKFPKTEEYIGFGDFGFYRIIPKSIRFVAGFAKAFNLTPEGLRHAATAQ